MKHPSPSHPDRRQFFKTALAGSALLAAGRVDPLTAQNANDRPYPIRVSSMDVSIGHRAEIEGVKLAHQIGLDGLQVQYDPDLRKPNSLRHKKTIFAYRDEALKWNVQINSLCIGAFGGTPLKSEPAGVPWIEESLECANMLGAAVILIPILGGGHLETEEDFTRLIAVLKELGPKAEDHGVALGLECWISGKDQLRIMEEVNSPGVRIYYDFHNAVYRGHDPLAEIPFLGQYFCEVHVKNMNGRTGDYNMREQGAFKNPTPAGRTKGLDHPAIARALAKTGYTGWLSLENPPVGKDKMAAMKDNVAYVREVYGAAMQGRL